MIAFRTPSWWRIPGCYATSVILALAPLLKAGLVDREHGIISDSKSGVSGAGKAPTSRTHFVSVADNLSAYSVFNHRHLGEMVEQLGLEDAELTFTPHLLPIPRGILSTIYVRLKRAMKPAEVESCLREFLFGQTLGASVCDAEAAAVAVFAAHELLRPWVLPGGGRAAAGAGFLRGQSDERRGGTGGAEHESDVWVGRAGGFAVTIVVKIGGAAIEDAATLRKCARSIAELAQDGHRVAVVHGGGSALTRMLNRLGKRASLWTGLRVTDAETRDTALMVLGGIINKKLVAAIQSAGMPAIGFCGGDGMTFRARKKFVHGRRPGVCRRDLFRGAVLD